MKDLFPPLEETAHSRDSLIDALRNEVALPSPEVAVAAFYVEDIEQDILDVLDRARVSELDLPDIRLLFRGLHILGGRRRPTGFPALVAFLRGPFERVDEVFAETITDTSVQAIVAGMFNGDIDLLMGLITDREIDPLVREATMRAFVCLVIDGRIERPFAADFLRRFDEERMAPPGDAPWHAWATAVALLRFEELSQRVHAAYADDRVPHVFTTVTDFDALLAAALQQPNDPELMNEERVGYIEDVLATLQECDSWGDDEDDPFELSPDDRYNDDDDTDFDRLGPGVAASCHSGACAQSAPARRAQRSVSMRQRQEIQEVLPDDVLTGHLLRHAGQPANGRTQKTRRGFPRRVFVSIIMKREIRSWQTWQRPTLPSLET